MKDVQATLKTLASNQVAIAETNGRQEGTLIVLSAVFYALVRTHPDPKAFAAAFRTIWTQFGSRHSDAEFGASLLDGIDAQLTVVECASRVPLNVRPPGAAQPPDP